jgi:hypothetical protein
MTAIEQNGNPKKKGRQDQKITEGRIEDQQNALDSLSGSRRFASLQISAALAGADLDRIELDSGETVYTVSRSGLVCEQPDLDAVARWLDQALGARP